MSDSTPTTTPLPDASATSAAPAPQSIPPRVKEALAAIEKACADTKFIESCMKDNKSYLPDCSDFTVDEVCSLLAEWACISTKETAGIFRYIIGQYRRCPGISPRQQRVVVRLWGQMLYSTPYDGLDAEAMHNLCRRIEAAAQPPKSLVVDWHYDSKSACTAVHYLGKFSIAQNAVLSPSVISYINDIRQREWSRLKKKQPFASLPFYKDPQPPTFNPELIKPGLLSMMQLWDPYRLTLVEQAHLPSPKAYPRCDQKVEQRVIISAKKKEEKVAVATPPSPEAEQAAASATMTASAPTTPTQPPPPPPPPSSPAEPGCLLAQEEQTVLQEAMKAFAVSPKPALSECRNPASEKYTGTKR